MVVPGQQGVGSVSGVQERVLCLIDGYPALFGGVNDEGTKQAQIARIDRVLKSRPGHWYLVGHRSTRRSEGSEPRTMRDAGFEVEVVNGDVYARVPHPDGRPLSELVAKRQPWTFGDKLPELAVDGFGWSRNELNQAMATARAWLFPTEGIAAA